MLTYYTETVIPSVCSRGTIRYFRCYSYNRIPKIIMVKSRHGTMQWALILVTRTRFQRVFKTFFINVNFCSSLDKFIGQKNPIIFTPVLVGGWGGLISFWLLGPQWVSTHGEISSQSPFMVDEMCTKFLIGPVFIRENVSAGYNMLPYVYFKVQYLLGWLSIMFFNICSNFVIFAQI